MLELPDAAAADANAQPKATGSLIGAMACRFRVLPCHRVDSRPPVSCPRHAQAWRDLLMGG